VNLSYQIEGEGEPVLLVCGTGQPAFSWGLHQVPALVQAGYRVVTFDNRGIEPSAVPEGPYSVEGLADDAAKLIEQLEIGPCRVAGLSLGAFITQELALARPDLVRAAVMMGTFGRQDVFRRAIMRAWVEFDESGIELPRIYDVVYSSFALFSPESLCDDSAMSLYMDVTASMPEWKGPGRVGQHHADAAYDNRLEALKGISVPAMVVGFELDMMTPTVLCREVADAIPGCVYVEIDGVGHAGPFEKPEEVNETLVEFFASV
jgi:pimeloyl-ACP methyl ester carboxylesterase